MSGPGSEEGRLSAAVGAPRSDGAEQAPIDGTAVATRIGTGISVLLGAYILVAVVPQWPLVVARVVSTGRLSWPAVTALYCLLLLSSAAHSITYYRIMGSTGAVAAGLMQAARAVGVFLASALLFCGGPVDAETGELPKGCFTLARLVATVLVCGGIYAFSLGKEEKAKASLPPSPK
jgi:hypothetical protein